MEKILINEVERVRELMGVKLLMEQGPFTSLLDDVLEFATKFARNQNVLKSEFSDALEQLKRVSSGAVNASDDELVKLYSKLANAYPEVAEEIAPKIISNLDVTLKSQIDNLKSEIQVFQSAGATEEEVLRYIDGLFTNGNISSPIREVTTLLKRDLDDFAKGIYGTLNRVGTTGKGYINLKPQDIPTAGSADLDKLQKLYRAKGLGSLLKPINQMRQYFKDFFTSSTKLMDETLSLTKSMDSMKIPQKNDALKRISSNLEELAKKESQVFDDYRLWLETYIKPVDFKMYEKIVKTEGFKKAEAIYSGEALKEIEKVTLDYAARRNLLREQIKDVIYPSRWFGKNMVSKLKAAGKDAKVGKLEKWGKIINPSSPEYSELRRWLFYGGTRTPRQYVEYGSKMGWFGLGKDLFLNYVKRLLTWTFYVSMLDYITDLLSVPLSKSDWDYLDIMKKQYMSYQERGVKEIPFIGGSLESEKDDTNMESLFKFLGRAGINIPVYFFDNLKNIQTVIPGFGDDIMIMLQELTRQLTPEELEKFKISVNNQKQKAKEGLENTKKEFKAQTGKDLPDTLAKPVEDSATITNTTTTNNTIDTVEKLLTTYPFLKTNNSKITLNADKTFNEKISDGRNLTIKMIDGQAYYVKSDGVDYTPPVKVESIN